MYKSIVPKLVSFDTNVNFLRGFYYSDNFNHFKPVNDKSLLHFKIRVGDVMLPVDFDFRSGYYTKLGTRWYYDRSVFGLHLSFIYDELTSEFVYSKLYNYIPFEIGGIHPLGKHLADLISYRLYLNEFDVFRGCAFAVGANILAFVTPGMNGKTTLVHTLAKEYQNIEYIAEDILVVHRATQTIYPVPIHKYNYGRSINRKLHAASMPQAHDPKKYTSLTCIFTSTTKAKVSNLDLSSVCGFQFIGNPFIRAIMGAEGTFYSILDRAMKSSVDLSKTIVFVSNFGYTEYLKHKYGITRK